MIKPILSAVALIAMSGTPAMAEDPDAPLTKGEQKLAKMLEGREAGEPQSCIRARPVRKFTVIDRTAIVYRIGRTMYVNVPRNAGSLDDSDALVFRRFGSQVCKTDIVTSIDRFNGFYTGNVFLGDFVPYTKIETEG
ncbi:hypothetical protein OAS19_01490 [Altererythrobacter sp.]|nr:hypothetical protein [Altererythrobacter sp.]